MYKRLFVLGLEKDSKGVIKTVKVLDESQLELELARIPNCIGCKLTAPRNMLKVFTLKDLIECVKGDKVSLTNAEISKAGDFKLLEGYRVTEIVKDGIARSVKGAELLQLIYKATVPVMVCLNNKMREVERKVVVGCTVDGDIKVLDYTEYKPPELICDSVVNCKCTVNNNNTVSVRRNNGDFRESDFHLSRVLTITSTNSGVIFLDKRGFYYYLDSDTSTISKGNDSINMEWFTNLANINGVRSLKSDEDVAKVLYNCKGSKLVCKLGVSNGKKVKDEKLLSILDSNKLSKEFKKLYKVHPLFDVVDLVNIRGVKDELCEKHFDTIPKVRVMCIKLVKGSQFTKQYGISYLGTVYLPSCDKLLDLKYFSIRWHKTSSHKVIINAFYKGRSRRGRLSNFMDIIDGETGEVLNSVELNEKLVDTIIDTYAKNIASNNMSLGRTGTSVKELIAYKEFLKAMCILDNRIN